MMFTGHGLDLSNQSAAHRDYSEGRGYRPDEQVEEVESRLNYRRKQVSCFMINGHNLSAE